jgi:peptidoglycan/xylan/chitin deacetylase (PgdA/CDA1 family)
MTRQISLLYHDVVVGDLASSGFSGADADIYKLRVHDFEAHLEAVYKAVLNTDAHVSVLSDPYVQESTSKLPVYFTFDDGGSSAHEPTASLLEAQGWRGHFFIVTSRIGDPGFLTAAQIADLRKRGHLIGSHSHTHPQPFSALSYERMLSEWKESRQILEEIVKERVWSASVPGGYYSSVVAQSAEEAGYRVLFNSEPTAVVRRKGNLVVLGRYGLQGQSSPSLAGAFAAGNFFPRLWQYLIWNGKKPLKKIKKNSIILTER